MGCCNGGEVNTGGWRLVTEQKMAMDGPLRTESVPAQPRAPASADTWPLWAWVLIALVALSLLGSRG